MINCSFIVVVNCITFPTCNGPCDFSLHIHTILNLQVYALNIKIYNFILQICVIYLRKQLKVKGFNQQL